jgi:hypothetical protein
VSVYALTVGIGVLLLALPAAAAAETSPLAHMELLAASPANVVSFHGACDPGGTSTITFSGSGTVRNSSDGTTGNVSYPGTFTVSGSVVIGPQNQTPGSYWERTYNGGPVGAVEAYNETFTIHTLTGTTVSGSETLDNNAHPTEGLGDFPAGWFSFGQCSDQTTAYGPQALQFSVSADVSATATAPGGSTSNSSALSWAHTTPAYSYPSGALSAIWFDEDLASGYSGPTDTTAPTASPTLSPAPGPNGWSSGNVTVNWNWTDSGGSGIDPSRCDTTTPDQGSGVYQVNAVCYDRAGNIGRASYTIKVAKTVITMGPQAMDGNLKVTPGEPLDAGFDFTMPGAHAAATENFVNGQVAFAATCADGSAAGTIMVPLTDSSFSDPAGSSSWYASDNQSDSSTYQGSVAVPDLCNGGTISLAKGGTFSSGIWSDDFTDKVNVRWHYRAGGTGGGWSGTTSVIPS